jgi:hypothetical protein
MMHNNYYQQDDYWARERRKAKMEKLREGITNYAFYQLMNGNKEKAMRAVNVAMKLENELDKE